MLIFDRSLTLWASIMQQSSLEDSKTLIPKVAHKAKVGQTLETLIFSHGFNYHNAAEVSPKIMREIQLPILTICDSLKQPILKDLLVTRTGSGCCAAGHYIPHPEGSLDCVLHYCVAGKAWCEIGDRRWDVAEGNVLLLPAKVPHKYGDSKDGPWTFHWIHFRGNMALELCQLLGTSEQQPILQLKVDSENLACFDELYQWMEMAHTYDNLVAASGSLLRFLSLANTKRYLTNQPTQKTKDHISETVRFMETNLKEQLSLKKLAKIAHMSPSHYCTVFKKRNCCPPIEYFQRLKIQKACDLLTQTDLQVRQIALNLGFDDPFHFSRLFKSFVGVSPTQHRKES